VKRSERRSGNTDGGPAKQAKKRSLRAVNEHLSLFLTLHGRAQ
jgi:hypothetical protein